jgi:hypothetical protein
MSRAKAFVVFAVLLFLVTLQLRSALAAPPAGNEAALKASDITGKIFPDQVFFRGQVAPVQMRNTGGIRFGDDFYVLAGLVDNSGYSTSIRQKYQGYLITEVTLEVGGQKLAPGAYGVGFIAGNRFVVMDLGAHDVFQTSSAKDSEMKRPTPLQVVSSSGRYRFYIGRDYVDVARAQ